MDFWVISFARSMRVVMVLTMTSFVMSKGVVMVSRVSLWS